jgi:hypothetical protein
MAIRFPFCNQRPLCIYVHYALSDMSLCFGQVLFDDGPIHWQLPQKRSAGSIFASILIVLETGPKKFKPNQSC